MRIERIRTWRHFGRYVLDQIGHGVLALVAMAPGLMLGWPPSALVAWGAAALTVRELRDWERKSELAKNTEREMPFWKRHLDRTLDVVIGTGLASLVVGGLK